MKNNEQLKILVGEQPGQKYNFQTLFWKLYGERLRKSNKAETVMSKLFKPTKNYAIKSE